MKKIIVLIMVALLLSMCTPTRERRFERRQDTREQRLERKRDARCQRLADRYGCYPKEIVRNNTITKYKDTTITVHIPGDTLREVDTVFISDGGIVTYDKHRLDTEYAFSAVWIKDGKVHHILVQKDIKIKATIKDAIKQSESKIESKTAIEIKVPYEVKVPYVPRWIKILAWIGTIYAVLTLIYFIGGTILRQIIRP